LKNVEYYSDGGYILQGQKANRYTSIDRIGSEIFVQFNTTTFFSHIISITNLKDEYYRSYIKVQGIIAYIGGFITFFKYLLILANTYLAYPSIIHKFQKNYFHKNPKIKLEGNADRSFTNISKPNCTNESHIKQKNQTDKSLLQINKNSHDTSERNISSNVIITAKSGMIPLGLVVNSKKNFSKSQTCVAIPNYEQFSALENVLRLCCFNIGSLGNKKKSFAVLSKKYNEEMSMKCFIKYFRKIKIMESLIFDEYQSTLLKYIPFRDKLESSNLKIQASVDELKRNIDSDKVKINEKLYKILEFN